MVVREDELMCGWRRWMAVQDKMGVAEVDGDGKRRQVSLRS